VKSGESPSTEKHRVGEVRLLWDGSIDPGNLSRGKKQKWNIRKQEDINELSENLRARVSGDERLMLCSWR